MKHLYTKEKKMKILATFYNDIQGLINEVKFKGCLRTTFSFCAHFNETHDQVMYTNLTITSCNILSPPRCFVHLPFGYVSFYVPVTCSILFNILVFLQIGWKLVCTDSNNPTSDSRTRNATKRDRKRRKV